MKAFLFRLFMSYTHPYKECALLHMIHIITYDISSLLSSIFKLCWTVLIDYTKNIKKKNENLYANCITFTQIKTLS